jgi:hypothetical protein
MCSFFKIEERDLINTVYTVTFKNSWEPQDQATAQLQLLLLTLLIIHHTSTEYESLRSNYRFEILR